MIKHKRLLASLSKSSPKSSQAPYSDGLTKRHVESVSNFWQHIPLAPADPILGITEEFNKDSNPLKTNLSVGAYRDDEGKPYVLPSIRMASSVLYHTESNKEYTSINGSINYNSLVKEFLYGSFVSGADLIKQDRISIAQSLSGTGALKLCAEFLRDWSPYNSRKVYMPNPTWSNHINIFENSGLEPQQYAYYDKKTNSFDMEGMLNDLSNAEPGSSVLLHACCHNPTGVDPTPEQWDQIVDVVINKGLIPIIDIAYQGFQSGSLFNDLYLLELITNKVNQGQLVTSMVCQSFAKNMGLYGERIGSVSIITPDSKTRQIVDSQIKKSIRSIYSSPSIHGARLVEIVLSSPDIFTQWEKDVSQMASRIKLMRSTLFDLLEKKQTLTTWDHLVQQNGMFAFTGLSKEQIIRLKEEYSIYATLNGRFSIAGLNSGNVEYVADAMDKVTR